MPLLCLFVIFFGLKLAKSFRHHKIRVEWKPLAGVKGEVVKMLLIGLANLAVYIMSIVTTSPVLSLILFSQPY